MAILFDFYESPPQEAEEGKIRVYPRPVFTQTIDTNELADIIHGRSSLTKGDIHSTLISLGQVLSESLRSGYRVYMDGIGHFSVSLGCKEIHTKKDMHGNKVFIKAIDFRADKKLKAGLTGATIKRCKENVHSARLSDEEVNKRVGVFCADHHVFTRRDFQRICQMKKGLALKHINRLRSEGKIKNVGIRSQPIYVWTTRG